MIKLFVGLGNPGTEYEATRHNAGFWWVDELARDLKVNLVHDRGYHGLVARANVHGQVVWLLQPQTFMNVSGKSVAALARFYKIAPEEILVVHDELDVVPGQGIDFDRLHGYLLQATGRVENAGVPAKGLTGPGYDGHAFWDSEGFVLATLTATDPEAAADAYLAMRRRAHQAALNDEEGVKLSSSADVPAASSSSYSHAPSQR